MVSNTTQTERVRRRKRATNGRSNKKPFGRHPTPVFPIHPEGYDPKAPDGKFAAEATAAAPKKA